MQGKKILAGMALTAGLFCGMAFLPTAVHAASTEQMYLVDKISGNGTQGGICHYTYDKNGMVKQMIPDLAPAEKYSYENGNLKKISDAGMVTVLSYDSKGRLKGKSAKGKTIRYTYNQDDQVSKSVSETNYTGYATKTTKTYRYDDDGNVTKTTSDTGSNQIVTKYTYDKKGNFTGSKSETDYYEKSVACKNTYDSKGRLVKRVVKGSHKQKNTSSAGMSDANYTEEITYRQITVPKNKVAAVKEQQSALLGGESPKVSAWTD